MYNKAKGDVEKGEKKMRSVEAEREMMLPTTKAEVRMMNGSETPTEEKRGSVSAESSGTVGKVSSAYGRPRGMTFTNNSHPPPPLHGHPITIPSLSSSHPPPPPPQHSHPNLHIKITAPIPGNSRDGYPTPPLSLDSPPGSGAGIHEYEYIHGLGGKLGNSNNVHAIRVAS